MRLIAALTIALFASACAHAHEAMMGPPSFAPIPGEPAPAHAQLYADCIAQAAAHRGFDRQGNLLRFHCDGATAQAFFDGLGPYAAQIGSEHVADGRTYRTTQAMHHDLDGLDYCARTDATGAYECTVVLAVGEFLGAS